MEREYENAIDLKKMNVVASFLFFLEFYHVVVHLSVLFRIRLLPRKDLVRVRLYFLFDTCTVFTVYLYTRTFWWQDVMTVLQMIEHLYYFFFWEKTSPAKKIVSWSSLDYQETSLRKQWAPMELIGTFFDIMVHWTNVFLLCHMITTVEALVSVAIAFCLVYMVLFNPCLAWSQPINMPDWVRKRLSPLKPETWEYEGGVEKSQ